MIFPRARAAAFAVATLCLSSCSLMGERRVSAPPAEVVPPAPVYAAPVATHRFEIDAARDDVVGVVQRTVVGEEDTLSDIARRFNVGYEEIVRANPGVDPWLPGVGREVVVPTQYILPDAPREGVVVNLAAMRIYYFPARDPKTAKDAPQVVYTYPIGVGKVGWATPLGSTKVVRKQKDPVWRPTPSIRKEHAENGDPLPAVVKAGPDNPLGNRAMYLGWPTYLIHGTNKPYGVGLRSSHGCLRLYPEDIEKLYEQVKIGTPVRVVNQPFVFGWHDDELYLQAYDVLEDDTRDWQGAQRKLLSKNLAKRIRKSLEERKETIDWEAVSAVSHDPRGVPVSISAASTSIDTVIAAAPLVENRVPDGANWDGLSSIPADEEIDAMLSDTEASAPTAANEPQPAAKPAPAAAKKPRG